MMKKINEWLDAPWTMRRSIKSTFVAYLITAIIMVVWYVKECTYFFENLKIKVTNLFTRQNNISIDNNN